MKQHDKSRSKFFETMRVKMAVILDVPPDDIDMQTLASMAEDAVIRSCTEEEEESGEYIVVPSTNEENTALDENGQEIIRRIFSHEHPFDNWIEIFETTYLKHYLEGMNQDE